MLYPELLTISAYDDNKYYIPVVELAEIIVGDRNEYPNTSKCKYCNSFLAITDIPSPVSGLGSLSISSSIRKEEQKILRMWKTPTKKYEIYVGVIRCKVKPSHGMIKFHLKKEAQKPFNISNNYTLLNKYMYNFNWFFSR